uniref:Uncharacterized protein n=1 Tax=Kalanchoe fedtschenkoi TaxID=63787 RepID=A0A7N0TJP4_KALFE
MRMAPRTGGFKPEALEIVTDGFCEDNCIGRFQFEKSTAGLVNIQINDHTVNLFEKFDNYEVRPGDNEGRVKVRYCCQPIKHTVVICVVCMSPKVRGARKLSENSSEGAIIIWSSSGFCFFLVLHTQSTGVLPSNPVYMQRK